MPSGYRDALDRYVDASRTLGDSPDVERVSALLVASEELERQAALGLLAGEADVRELASAQLLAAAALDVSIAADMIALETGEGRERFEATYSESYQLLEAEPGLGMRALFFTEGMGAIGASPVTAGELRGVATSAIDEIAVGAVAIADACGSGLTDLVGTAVLGALADVAQVAAGQLLGPIYHHVSGRARVALRLLAKGVAKVLRALGPLVEQARSWLLGWLDDTFLSDARARIVRGVLDVSAVQDAVNQEVARAEQEGRALSARAEGAHAELSTLDRRFDKHRAAIERIAWLLGLIAGALVALTPWALAAIAGVYALLLAYGLWVAGDYLDWTRITPGTWLDRVVGVYGCVRAGVATV